MLYQPTKNEIIFSFYYALFKHKWLMLRTFVVILGAVIGGVMLMPPGYKATSTLWVHKRPRQNIQFFHDLEVPALNLNLNSPGINLIEVLTGQDVAEEMVDKYDLAERLRKISEEPANFREKFWYYFGEVFSVPGDAIEWVLLRLGVIQKKEKPKPDWHTMAVNQFRADWLSIKMIGNQTDILMITVWSQDPVLSKSICQDLVDVIIRKTLEMKHNEAAAALSFARQQVHTYERGVKRSAEQLRAFEEEHDITDLATEKSTRLTMFQQYTVAANDIQNNLATKETRLRALKQQIERQEEKFVSLIIYQNQKKEALELEVEIEGARSRLAEVYRDRDRVSAEIARLNELSIEHANLVRENRNKQSLLTNFDGKLEELQVQIVSQLSEFGLEVIDPPYLKNGMRRPSLPDWMMNLVIGIFLAAVTAICLPFVLEYWNESIRTEKDMERYLRASVLASFPQEGKVL